MMGWDGPMTHRQYLTWMEWLDERWNVPTKQDHYLAALRYEVALGTRRHPESLVPGEFLLKFGRGEQGPPPPRERDPDPRDFPPGIRPPRRVTRADIENVPKQLWEHRLRMLEQVNRGRN